MKIKNEIFESLNEIGVINLKRIEIPREQSYFLKRVMADIIEKSKPYFEEKQIIIDQYKISKNGSAFIPPDLLPVYLTELSRLQNIEIELNFEKMDLMMEDLPDKISGVQIDFLETFFNIKEART